MKKITLLALVMCFLTSCATTYYQVFSIKPENSSQTSNGSPIYTQDGLEFTYNFWGEYGNVRFIIYNSNDYDVIVDMTKSSFIRNNIAEDYYQGKQYETRVATGVYRSSKDGVSVNVNKQAAAGTLVNYMGRTYDVALSVGASVGANSEVGTTVKREWHTAVVTTEPEIVRIPAKSAKAFCSFNINDTRVSSSRLWASDYYNPIKFTKDTTPMEFRNRICIYQENGEPTYYDMNFYINEIGNVKGLYGMTKPTHFYISYSSTLEQKDTNEELFNSASKTSSKASSTTVSTTTNGTTGGKVTRDAYTRESAVATLNHIATELNAGKIENLSNYKAEVETIEKWYENFTTIYMDVEKALKAANKAIKAQTN